MLYKIYTAAQKAALGSNWGSRSEKQRRLKASSSDEEAAGAFARLPSDPFFHLWSAFFTTELFNTAFSGLSVNVPRGCFPCKRFPALRTTNVVRSTSLEYWEVSEEYRTLNGRVRSYSRYTTSTKVRARSKMFQDLEWLSSHNTNQCSSKSDYSWSSEGQELLGSLLSHRVNCTSWSW